jgi:hypothetical protein
MVYIHQHRIGAGEPLEGRAVGRFARAAAAIVATAVPRGHHNLP